MSEETSELMTRLHAFEGVTVGKPNPARDPVTPEDIAATIYQALGIHPETRIHDHLNRPHSVALGDPITAILR